MHEGTRRRFPGGTTRRCSYIAPQKLYKVLSPRCQIKSPSLHGIYLDLHGGTHLQPDCSIDRPVTSQYWRYLKLQSYRVTDKAIIQLYTCQPGPPVLDRLSIFSDLAAAKAHLHVQHKLGTKLLKVSNQQSTKCYTKYQEFVAPNRWQRRTV